MKVYHLRFILCTDRQSCGVLLYSSVIKLPVVMHFQITN